MLRYSVQVSFKLMMEESVYNINKKNVVKNHLHF